MQLIEQGKLRTDTPVSTYLPAFENPIILDDVLAEKPSFKPATGVVRVEHLLNYSSGLFYPQGLSMPASLSGPHDERDPVGHFYNLIKASSTITFFWLLRLYVMLICLCRAICLLFPSNLNRVPTVSPLSPMMTLLMFTYSELVVYGYSSDTLGFIIEKITGKKLEEYW